jgi:competence protein ComEC
VTLILLALAWLGAVAAVALWGLPPWAIGMCLAVCTPALAVLRGRHWALVCAAAAVLALIAGVRFEQWQQREPASLARFVEQSVVIEGRVVSEPLPGETSTAYIVEVTGLRNAAGEASAQGKLRASLGQYTEYLPGTRLRLTGKLSDPPVFPDFDYRGYLNRQDVVATMAQPVVEVLAGPSRWRLQRNITEARLELDHALQRALPEPEASLAGGIAFGRDGNLPRDLADDFRDTGLAHIVAVSGSNVSLVTAVTFLTFTWLVGKRWALLPAGLTVVAYLFVAGLSASVIRAGAMAVILLFGTFLGRQQSSLAALGGAAIAMTLWQPSAALDLGFQLSLSATAGLIVFGPWIRYGIELASDRSRVRLPDFAVQVTALSLSATLATMPIAWVNFGRVSLVGPVANILIEPLFIVAFWLSAATAVLGAAWEPAGWAAGLAAYYPLSFITWFARTVATLPFAAVDVPETSGSVALAAYGLLCAAGWFAYRRYAPVLPGRRASRSGGVRRRRLLQAGTAGVVAIVIVPVSLWPARGPGEFEMTVLDVGNGDAVLFTTPAGHHVLVDGGPSGIQLVRELGATLPHWERRIDAVFVLQPQAEHAGGIPEALERFDVGRRAGADAVASLHAGDRYVLDGVTFEVLWPPTGESSSQANDSAIVIRATYRETSFLLAANLGAAEQKQLIASSDVRSTVLVVPHHGANKTDTPLITAVHPSAAIIPVGDGRYASQPTTATLEALKDATLFRTDSSGRVTIRSDGKRLRYETQR